MKAPPTSTPSPVCTSPQPQSAGVDAEAPRIPIVQKPVALQLADRFEDGGLQRPTDRPLQCAQLPPMKGPSPAALTDLPDGEYRVGLAAKTTGFVIAKVSKSAAGTTIELEDSARSKRLTGKVADDGTFELRAAGSSRSSASGALALDNNRLTVSMELDASTPIRFLGGMNVAPFEAVEQTTLRAVSSTLQNVKIELLRDRQGRLAVVEPVLGHVLVLTHEKKDWGTRLAGSDSVVTFTRGAPHNSWESNTATLGSSFSLVAPGWGPKAGLDVSSGSTKGHLFIPWAKIPAWAREAVPKPEPSSN